MKVGSRGWMTVKKLRELLIEIPGDFMVTTLDDGVVHIADSERAVKQGIIDFKEEKAKMVEK